MVRTAFLTPGQGGYLPGIFAELAEEYSGISEVLAIADDVGSRFGCTSISTLLTNPAAPKLHELTADDPATAHLAIYTTSVAAFRLLIDVGARPDLLVGHSFGEIAACAAAGVFTIEDGAVIAAQRDESLRRYSTVPGGMMALNIGYRRADHLLHALDDWMLTIATDNSPDQVVVSGPDKGLDKLAAAATTIGITATRLPVSYPFHNRWLLASAADDFATRVADIVKRRPTIPIYSPLLNRYIDSPVDADALIVGHLTRPARFLDAIRTIHDDGVRTYIECGAKAICCDLVEAIVPTTRILAPLRSRATAGSIVDDIDTLGEGTTPQVDPRATPVVPVRRRAVSKPTPAYPVAAATSALDEDRIYEKAREIYSATLGYPKEALSPDADLEADLGIDSIKQTELFVKLLKHYGLSMPVDTPRMTSYPTMRSIAQLVGDTLAQERV